MTRTYHPKPGVYLHQYKVEMQAPSAPFPLSMLCHDNSYPAFEEGVKLIEESLGILDNRKRKNKSVRMVVELRTLQEFKQWKPSDQWLLTGWRVVPDSHSWGRRV